MQIIIAEQKSDGVVLHFNEDIVIHSDYFPNLPLLINKIIPSSTIFKEKLNYEIMNPFILYKNNIYILKNSGIK